MQGWFTAETKKRVADAIREAESHTSAEFVVSVRHESASYLHADLIGGLVFAMGYLCLFLYYPRDFDYTYLPIEETGAFVLGCLLVHAVRPLRRLLVGKKLRRENVHRAARAAFVERGVSRTHARNGILVYISAFERESFVVCDVGIDQLKLGEAWSDTKKVLQRAVHEESIEEFLLALKGAGHVLGEQFVHTDDDVNELPDEVDDAGPDSADSADESDDEDEDGPSHPPVSIDEGEAK